MTELISCPYCSSKEINRVLKSKDYFLTKEEFNIDHCRTCNIKFTNPKPFEQDIAKYYESIDYVSHGTKKRSLIDRLYTIARRFTINRKIKLIQGIKSEGTVLDYGCGTGDFLLACSKVGYNITGIEPSEKARTLASKNLKKEVEKASANITNNHFDIITLWHVLEHVYDIKDLIGTLKAKLKKGGTMVIAVPNHRSLDSEIYKEFWAAYDLPRHLWHFEKSTIKKIFEDEGLKIEKILPMKLDAYYVSILSEKYKHEQKIRSYVNALSTGYKSNNHAKRTGEYSSHIYLLK